MIILEESSASLEALIIVVLPNDGVKYPLEKPILCK